MNNKFAVQNLGISSIQQAVSNAIVNYGNSLFPNCILYYPFSTDLLNYASGTGVTQGILIGSSTVVGLSTTQYKIGSGSFYSPGSTGTGQANTTPSYFNITYGSPLPQNQNGYTFSFWIYVSSISGGNPAYILYLNNNFSSNTNNTISIYLRGQSLTLLIDGQERQLQAINPAWYHMVITINTSGSVNLYLNGSFAANSSVYYINPIFNYGCIYSNTNTIIGANVTNSANCYINEFRYYDSVLTPTQVQMLYYYNNYKNIPSNVLFPNCKLYYPFNGDILDYATGGGISDASITANGATSLKSDTYTYGAGYLQCTTAVATTANRFALPAFTTGNQNGYTFSSWLKVDDNTSDGMFYSFNQDNGSNKTVRIFLYLGTNANGVKSLRINSTGADVNWFVPALNVWYHIAWTLTTATPGGALNCYVNGIKYYTGTVTYLNTTFAYNSLFYDPCGGTSAIGCIDDFRYYDTVLNGPQIYSLYSYNLPSNSPKVMFPGCMLYYPLDGDTSNYSSGTGIAQGAITGALTFDKTVFKFGTSSLKSVTFGTSGAYYNAGSLPANNYGYSFSCWIYVTQYGTNYGRIFQLSNSPSYSIEAYISPTGLLTVQTFYITNNTITVNFPSNDNKVVLNTWYHIAWTLSSAGTFNSNVYINGVLVSASQTLTYISFSITDSLLLGDKMNNPGYSMTGYLDDFRYYDAVLTPAQIQMLYNYSSSSYNISNDGIICYYPFDNDYYNYASGIPVNDATNVTYSPINNFISIDTTTLTAWTSNGGWTASTGTTPLYLSCTSDANKYYIYTNTGYTSLKGYNINFQVYLTVTSLLGACPEFAFSCNYTGSGNMLRFEQRSAQGGAANCFTTFTAWKTAGVIFTGNYNNWTQNTWLNVVVSISTSGIATFSVNGIPSGITYTIVDNGGYIGFNPDNGDGSIRIANLTITPINPINNVTTINTTSLTGWTNPDNNWSVSGTYPNQYLNCATSSSYIYINTGYSSLRGYNINFQVLLSGNGCPNFYFCCNKNGSGQRFVFEQRSSNLNSVGFGTTATWTTSSVLSLSSSANFTAGWYYVTISVSTTGATSIYINGSIKQNTSSNNLVYYINDKGGYIGVQMDTGGGTFGIKNITITPNTYPIDNSTSVLTKGSLPLPILNSQTIQVSNMLFNNSGISISFWYKLNNLSYSGDLIRIIQFYNNSGDYFYFTFNYITGLNSIQFSYSYYYSGGEVVNGSRYMINDKNWHHYFITINSSGLWNIYIDNILQGGSYKVIGNWYPTTGINYSVWIGTINGGGNSYYQGSNMNAFLVFNRILTESERAILYYYPSKVNIVSLSSQPSLTNADITNYEFRIAASTSSVPTTDITNKYTITNTGSVTIINDSSRGNVLNFTGSNYLQLASINTPNNATRTFWFRPADNTTVLSLITGTLIASPVWTTNLNMTPTTNGIISTSVGMNPTYGGISGKYVSNPNFEGAGWNFYAITTSTTSTDYIILYVNGNIVASGNDAITYPYTDVGPVTLGAYYAPSTGYTGTVVGPNNYLTGYMDDIRQYNYTLTPSQIKQIFNSTLKNVTFTDIKNYKLRLQAKLGMVPNYDKTGHYTITNNGNVIVINDAIRGNVFSFSGSNYLSVSALTTMSSTRTFWAKTNTPTSGTGNVFSSTNLSILFNGTSNMNVKQGSTTIADPYYEGNGWVFYAVTITSTTLSIYVNGNLTPNKTTTISGWSDDNAAINFGYGTTGSSYFTGLLDDMRQYNFALTPQQIQQLYYSTLINQIYNINNSGLLAYYPFNKDFNDYSSGSGVSNTTTTGTILQNTTTDLSNGLIWWYKYQTADIVSGNIYNYVTGTYDSYIYNYVSSPDGLYVDTTTSLGALSSSLKFGNGQTQIGNTTVQYIKYPTINSTTTAYTLSFVFKYVSADTGRFQSLLTLNTLAAGSADNGYNGGLAITQNSTTTSMSIYDSGNTVLTIPNLFDGNAHHLTFIFGTSSGATILPKLYIDGIYIGVSTQSTHNTIVSNAFGFGYCNWSSQYFNGWLGETRMYNYAMTDTQVYYLYNTMMGITSTNILTNLNLGSIKLPSDTSNYIKLKSPITFGSIGITIAFWYKLNTLTPAGVNPRLFEFAPSAAAPSSSNTTFTLTFGASSTNLVFYIMQTSNAFLNTGNIYTIPDTNWHHICVMVNPAGVWSFYVDGVSKSPTTAVTLYPTTLTMNSFTIGISSDTNYNYFMNANMAQLYVFSRMLTTSEISYLYNYPTQVTTTSAITTITSQSTSLYNINNTSLLYYYPFDVDYKNYSGTTLDFTVTGSGYKPYTTPTTKLLNGSVTMPQSDSNSLKITPNITFTTNGITIAFWYKLNSLTNIGTSKGYYTRLFDIAQTINSQNYSLSLVFNGGNTTSLVFFYFSSTAATLYSPPIGYTFNDTNWHHICCVVNPAGVWSFYVDNVLQSGTFTQYPVTNIVYNSLVLGQCQINSNCYYANANMNSFTIFNRVLTPIEIFYLYTYPTQITFTSQPTTADPYLSPSNMLVALSIRRIIQGYTGPIISVRNSSDATNTSQDFYTDELQSYLTTGPNKTGSAYSTWIGANTGYITKWYDQSGKGNHATNSANNTTQPIILLFNGNYYIQFINTNSTQLNLTTAVQPNTIFCNFYNSNSSYGTIISSAYGLGQRFSGSGLTIDGDSNSGDWYKSSSGTKLSYVNGVSSSVLSSLYKFQSLCLSVQNYPTTVPLYLYSIGNDTFGNSRSINGFMMDLICHNTQMSSNSMVTFYNNILNYNFNNKVITFTGSNNSYTNGNYTIYAYTTVGAASNSITITNAINLPMQVFIVAGGGSGGCDQTGGGGGGGVIQSVIYVTGSDTVSLTVGDGGTAYSTSTPQVQYSVSGNNSTMIFTTNTGNNKTAYGGGGGASYSSNSNLNSSGNAIDPSLIGSGGGGSSYTQKAAGTTTSGQGNSGGLGGGATSTGLGGGGGGAGSVGSAGSGSTSGAGGDGVKINTTTLTFYSGATIFSKLVSNIWWAGGGGGGGCLTGVNGGNGGKGGGGGGSCDSGTVGAKNTDGINDSNAGANALASPGGAGGLNTGGGGGGSSHTFGTLGGKGGSGIILIAVPTHTIA